MGSTAFEPVNDAATKNNLYIYEQDADHTVQIRVEGLVPDETYRFGFYDSYLSDNSDRRLGKYVIGAQSVTLQPGYNYNDVAYINFVTPDAEGNVTIDLEFGFDPCESSERMCGLAVMTIEGIFADCGDPTNPYPDGDLSRDCWVALEDLSVLADDWQGCTDPGIGGCIEESFSPVYAIVSGSVTVDGNLSEWAGAEWMSLDQVYWGDPCDIPATPEGAMFALKWSESQDKVYAAVIVEDGDHVFENNPMNWNTSDRIEIYMQGDPNGGTGYGGGDPDGIAPYDKAQQYAVGAGLAPFHFAWGRWGTGAYVSGTGVTDAQFEYAVSVGSTTVMYEVGAKAFVWYGGRSGVPTVVREIVAGDEVGFDVIVDTRHGSLPLEDPDYSSDFGMRSENMMTRKWDDAGQFRKWTLADTWPGLGCGNWGYLYADLNEDCYVDIGDLVIIVQNWLTCSDPGDPFCQ